MLTKYPRVLIFFRGYIKIKEKYYYMGDRMDKFIESIKKIMIEDRKKIISNRNIEDLYIWEVADKWIDKNAQNQQEFEQKLDALGSILKNSNFESAIKTSALAFRENNTDKAIETVELIKKVTHTKEYIKNSEISGYKILSKYEEPSTYKTDSFIVHTNIMIRLYKYLEEKLCKVKEENYGK